MQQKFQVLIMNMTSRLVGAIIKIFTLITFLIAASASAIFWGLFIVFWFAYPLVIVGFIFYGFKLLISG